jgi:hypothetical protein
MNRARGFILLSASLGIAGCPTREKYDHPPTVGITAPASPTYTKTNVRVTAALDPPLGLPIALHKDGAEFTTLVPPKYEYVWDTTKAIEGTYTLTAEVVFSDKAVKSDPVTIVVDRQPPTAELTPEPGANNVILRSAIKVAFSEPIALAQPAASTFSLSVGGTTLPTIVTVSPDGRTAAIAISDLTSLALPASVSATIAPTITDRAGNAFVPPASWTWTVPDWIRMPTLNVAGAAMLVVGTDLRPVVAWPLFISDGALGKYQLQVSSGDGAQWQQLSPPSADLNSANGGYGLTLDAQNRPVAAWTETNAADAKLLRVATWNGNAWDVSLPPVATTSGSTSGPPRVLIDAAGRAVVFWAEPSASGPPTFFLARWSGTAWSPDFGSPPITGNYAEVILDQAGNPIVAWVDASSSGHVSAWTGSVWTGNPLLPGVMREFLALDSDGNPMLIGNSSFFEAFRIRSGSWEAVTPVAAPSGIYGQFPRLTTGVDHLPVIAWIDTSNNNQRTVAYARWLGTRWDARAGFFSQGSNTMDEVPQVVADRQGSVWVGWRNVSNAFNLWMSNY